MASFRHLFLSLVIPVSLVACGGGGDDGDDDGNITPSGDHFTYVVNDATVPANNSQARELGLDLNDDGTVDNQLGMVLGTLAGQGFDVQGAIDLAVADGSIILLFDMQTPAFDASAGTGFEVKLGANPSPAPCDGDPTDPATTCGLHLDGNGTFSVASSSEGVVGTIAGGVFTGGPGNISLQIALGAEPVQLDLIGARAKASGMSETALGDVILAGALTQEDLDTKVIPAIQAQIAPIVEADCPDAQAADCGCEDGSTGKTVIGLFDTNPKDCMVSVEEIKTNALIQSLLAPDVQIDGQDALSIGIGVTAVHANIQ